MQLRVLVTAHWILAAVFTGYSLAIGESINDRDRIALASAPPRSPYLGWSTSIENSRLQKRVIQGQDFAQLTHSFMRSPFPNIPYSWILRLRLTSLTIPAQPAASALAIFYDRMIDQIRQELNAHYNAITWQFGDITLEMRSRSPETDIPFLMVYNLLQELKSLSGRALVGTYEGEVASAVTAWSIWIRLRIAGA